MASPVAYLSDSLLKNTFETQFALGYKSGCEALAEGCKDEQVRLQLRAKDLMPLLVGYLRTALDEQNQLAIWQTLRAIANFLIDSPDEHNKEYRDQVIKLECHPIFMECFKLALTKHWSDVIRTLCGTCINASMNHPEVTEMLAGPDNSIIPFLSALVSTPSPSPYQEIFPLAVTLLTTLVSSSLGAKTIVERNCLPELTLKICPMSLNVVYHLEESLEVAEALEGAIIIDDAVQRALYKSGGFTSMQKYVSILRQDVEGGDKELEEARLNLRKRIAKLVALTVLNDENANEIIDNINHLDTFRGWLDPSEPLPDIQASAALVFGNLARSDEHCKYLMNDCKIADSLLQLLIPEQNAQILHAVLGCLKNLLFVPDNKVALVKAGLVQKVHECQALKSTVRGVRSMAVGVLRGMITSDEFQLDSIVSNDEIIIPVIEMARADEDPACKSESGRLTASAIKLCTTDSQRKTLINAGALQAITQLISQNHNILKHEGLVALTVCLGGTEDIRTLAHTALLQEDVRDIFLKAIESVADQLLESEEFKSEHVALCMNLCAMLITSTKLIENGSHLADKLHQIQTKFSCCDGAAEDLSKRLDMAIGLLR